MIGLVISFLACFVCWLILFLRIAGIGSNDRTKSKFQKFYYVVAVVGSVLCSIPSTFLIVYVIDSVRTSQLGFVYILSIIWFIVLGVIFLIWSHKDKSQMSFVEYAGFNIVCLIMLAGLSIICGVFTTFIWSSNCMDDATYSDWQVEETFQIEDTSNIRNADGLHSLDVKCVDDQNKINVIGVPQTEMSIYVNQTDNKLVKLTRTQTGFNSSFNEWAFWSSLKPDVQEKYEIYVK